eukprot:gene17783-24817_t
MNNTNANVAVPNAARPPRSRTGVRNFTEWEVNTLLDITERILPLGADHWQEDVATLFNTAAQGRDQSAPPRESDSLKTKFKALKNVKKPTGDPDCPPLVRRAKRIYYQIEQRMSVVIYHGSYKIQNSKFKKCDGFGSTNGNSVIHTFFVVWRFWKASILTV